MKKENFHRMKRVAFWAALFVIIGFLYSVFVSYAHFGIPCMFHIITGLKCPGCGITASLMSILHFDFYSALKYNMFIPLIIIYILLVFIHTSCHYIKTGKFHLGSGSNVIDIIFLAVFLLWWILRNFWGI